MGVRSQKENEHHKAFNDAKTLDFFSLMVLSWVLLHKKTNNQPIVDVMFINAQRA